MQPLTSIVPILISQNQLIQIEGCGPTNTDWGLGPLYTNRVLGCQKVNIKVKKTITCNKTLHVQFFVRAECFAYLPACAHVPLFFTRQNNSGTTQRF